jgi:hypothetical protein
MFTKTFTIERHIEELRAELRTVTDAGERSEIQVELDANLLAARNLDHESEATI